jgi:hypothetical protein
MQVQTYRFEVCCASVALYNAERGGLEQSNLVGRSSMNEAHGSVSVVRPSTWYKVRR